MQQPGLYFPYVHVRDDDWLKVAALYWPTVRRLVPRGYAKHDSPTAQAFFDARLLRDEDPGVLLDAVTWDLLKSLRTNADLLVRDYSLQRAHADRGRRDWADSEGSGWEVPDLGWIHTTKFPPDVVGYLEQKGLAVRGRKKLWPSDDSGVPEDWIGMHPGLAGAYMAALASQVSERAHFQPLTDQADLRVATPCGNAQSAVHLLLGGGPDHAAADVATETYVMLALQHARPRNLGSIPADKIVECREDLTEELATFRDYVAAKRADLAEMAAIPVPDRKLEAFAEYVEQTVELPLQKLERGLRLHKLEPSRSLLMMGSFAPPAAAGAALTYTHSPVAATTAGAVAAVGNAWWQIENVRDTARSSAPVGYLLDVRDHLTPKTLASRARRILRGTYGRRGADGRSRKPGG